MPKVEIKEITITSVSITLTMSEAMDLEDILSHKVCDYELEDSARVTSKRLRDQLTEILDKGGK